MAAQVAVAIRPILHTAPAVTPTQSALLHLISCRCECAVLPGKNVGVFWASAAGQTSVGSKECFQG